MVQTKEIVRCSVYSWIVVCSVYIGNVRERRVCSSSVVARVNGMWSVDFGFVMVAHDRGELGKQKKKSRP